MKKNAFTLIELIATIGLLGMIATITITISVRKINETKERARDTMIESIKLAAKEYISDYGNDVLEFNNYDNAYITLQTLVEKEYFTESLIDPTTKKSIPLTNEIYVTREENGTITSIYNINQRKEAKLTLIGSYNEYVEEGTEYIEKGVTALSPSKEDVSSSVTITGTVDTTIPNTYKITYMLDNVKITRNVIVYGKNLGTNEYYKFTINLDGGTDNKNYQTKYEVGSKIELEIPTKEGYTFKGWKINGKGYNINGNILTMGYGVTTITAIWEEEQKEVTPVSFSTDSWETIVEAVKQAYKKGTKYPYEVGNTKTVDMGSLGIHTLRVANTTKCSEVEVESKTACGFVLEFKDIITTYEMNGDPVNSSGATNAGGWPASEMRAYLNDLDANDTDDGVIYNALPDALKKGIIDTYVISSKGNETITGDENVVDGNFYSTDKIYLLSSYEVWGSKLGSDTAATEEITRQLDYYEEKNVTTSSYVDAKKTIKEVQLGGGSARLVPLVVLISIL